MDKFNRSVIVSGDNIPFDIIGIHGPNLLKNNLHYTFDCLTQFRSDLRKYLSIKKYGDCLFTFTYKLNYTSCMKDYYSNFLCERTRDLTLLPENFSYNSLDVKGFSSCPKGFFACKPENFCISIVQVCDEIPDCPTANDELNCSGSIEFICENMERVPMTSLCNHRIDCSDNSDEKHCEFNCLNSNFQCKTGKCIPMRQFCDSEINCIDRSDEDCKENCTTFFCEKRCLRDKNICDLKQDCTKEAAEKDEIPEQCFKGYYRNFSKKNFLKSGCDPLQPEKQIFIRHHYNKSSSETFCRVKYDSMGELITKPHYPFEELRECLHIKCKQHEYQCRDKNYCISLENVCDGISHCYFSDDEIACGINNSHL
ncbi:DgyrCDS3682 [Dimorphilus gyrociliatus]|uniref:DgyrCDS3682 n=1 Tax=Dimorphilus gyrociliatus TaxID=2664684 RepID=A0A7I8VEL0_9ANNE|nr:DgyrCDS3682 [Dimorphilus gyrociliatus]